MNSFQIVDDREGGDEIISFEKFHEEIASRYVLCSDDGAVEEGFYEDEDHEEVTPCPPPRRSCVTEYVVDEDSIRKIKNAVMFMFGDVDAKIVNFTMLALLVRFQMRTVFNKGEKGFRDPTYVAKTSKVLTNAFATLLVIYMKTRFPRLDNELGLLCPAAGEGAKLAHEWQTVTESLHVNPDALKSYNMAERIGTTGDKILADKGHVAPETGKRRLLKFKGVRY